MIFKKATARDKSAGFRKSSMADIEFLCSKIADQTFPIDLPHYQDEICQNLLFRVDMKEHPSCTNFKLLFNTIEANSVIVMTFDFERHASFHSFVKRAVNEFSME